MIDHLILAEARPCGDDLALFASLPGWSTPLRADATPWRWHVCLNCGACLVYDGHGTAATVTPDGIRFIRERQPAVHGHVVRLMRSGRSTARRRATRSPRRQRQAERFPRFNRLADRRSSPPSRSTRRGPAAGSTRGCRTSCPNRRREAGRSPVRRSRSRRRRPTGFPLRSLRDAADHPLQINTISCRSCSSCLDAHEHPDFSKTIVNCSYLGFVSSLGIGSLAWPRPSSWTPCR